MYLFKRLLRDFHEDTRAQAMTESALVMPLVVMVLIAANEFVTLENYKYLVTVASRFVVWEVAAEHDYPVKTATSEKEATLAEVNASYDAAGLAAWNYFFKDRGDAAGYMVSKTLGTGDDGFMSSFDESDWTKVDSAADEAGGEGGSAEGDVGTGSVFGSFSLASLGGKILTGDTIDLGFMRVILGPNLPENGFVRGGYSVAYKPLALALLIPNSDDSTADGSTKYAYYGSSSSQTNYETNILHPDIAGFTAPAGASMEEVMVIGMVEPHTEPSKRYSRFAMFTHSWRPQATGFSDPGGDGVAPSMGKRVTADDTLLYHVKGWTLLGGLELGWSGPGTGGDGDTGSLASSLGDLFPFKCCVLDRVVGHKGEDPGTKSHVGSDYPTW